jgi:uncharacterized protein YqeY
MIAQTLQQKIGEALKAHDEVRLSTLRLLSSAFNYERIAKQHELTDEEELVVIRKEAKQRRDSIEAYKKAGANDRAEKEEAELKILQEYLPQEMGDEELQALVDEAVGMANILADAAPQALQSSVGRIIGMVKSKAQGVDGNRIATMVKAKLNG